MLYGGDLGATVADYMRRDGGIITLDDLARYETIERPPVRRRHRGFEIAGAPPPTAGGLHLIEMLNILEGFDLRGLGFGTAEYFHLIAEILKIGFADRNACTGDPAFVDIPVERLTSKEYAATRRAQIHPDRAGDYAAPPALPPAPPTRRTSRPRTRRERGRDDPDPQQPVRVEGHGARHRGDPEQHHGALRPDPRKPASIAPGKRVTSSMAPTIVLRDGQPRGRSACRAASASSRPCSRRWST